MPHCYPQLAVEFLFGPSTFCIAQCMAPGYDREITPTMATVLLEMIVTYGFVSQTIRLTTLLPLVSDERFMPCPGYLPPYMHEHILSPRAEPNSIALLADKTICEHVFAKVRG